MLQMKYFLICFYVYIKSAHVSRMEASEYWEANKDKTKPGTRDTIEKKIIELNGSLVLPKGQSTLEKMWQRQESRNANLANLGQNAAKDVNSLSSESRLNKSPPIVITIDDDDDDDESNTQAIEPLVVLEVVVLENQTDCPLSGSNDGMFVGLSLFNCNFLICSKSKGKLSSFCRL